MERCRPFRRHGKSCHSWCSTGNDTRLRKLRTMTVHWSFFINIDGLCFCGNKIVSVFGFGYKWQRFPCSMKTSAYLQSGSSGLGYHAHSCLLRKRQWEEGSFKKRSKRSDALHWGLSDSDFVLSILIFRQWRHFTAPQYDHCDPIFVVKQGWMLTAWMQSRSWSLGNKLLNFCQANQSSRGQYDRSKLINFFWLS